MLKRTPAILLCLIFLCCPLFFFTGCHSKSDSSEEPPVFSPPQVLVEDNGTAKNIQLTSEDGTVYSYFLKSGEKAVLPFTSGSGTYQISCYEQINGSQYAALFAQTLEISLENEFLPFLYPNQYVNFSPESNASKLALSLLADDATDQEGIETIYNYVTQHITYDERKASTVESGYLPDVDETLASGTGICFDYAALMTAMLRSRDIPCKLQIGYAGDIKHAWIDVYIRGKGWVDHAITYNGEQWNRMDPTFTANSDNREIINSYIGDSDNYTLQFTR